MLFEDSKKVLVHVPEPMPQVLLALVEPPRFRHQNQSTAIVVDVSSSDGLLWIRHQTERGSPSCRSKQSACCAQSTTESSPRPVSTRSTLPTPPWSSSAAIS